MQDLNVIAQLNSEAHERDIPNQQAKGLYVVAEYHGLHYVGYSTHTSEVEANAKACEIGNEVGRRAKVYTPTAISAARQRALEAQGVKDDQLLADLGVVPPGCVGTDAGPGNASQEPTIASGNGGAFAGGGATSSWTDTSTADSDGGASSSSGE